MEDPAVVASRVTETAKGIADEARALANEAIAQSAEVQTYTAAKFIDTFTRTVNLAVKGSLQLSRDVLDQPGQDDPDADGRRQVADVMETISRRMVRQAGAVARDTAEKVEGQPYSPNTWVRSMVKLANISLLGTIELAETALIGPTKYEAPLTFSGEYHADGNGDRALRFKEVTIAEQAAGQLSGLHRPGTSDPIPAALVSFHAGTAAGEAQLPPGVLAGGPGNFRPLGALAVGQNTFRIGVDPRLLISGIYIGHVEVVVVEKGKNKVIDTVAVEIAI